MAALGYNATPTHALWTRGGFAVQQTPTRTSAVSETIATWIHGAGVLAYVPPEFDNEPLGPQQYARIYGRRHGWGTQFGPLTGTCERWFQIPVPCVPRRGRRTFLDEIALLFHSNRCGITQIDFWDGSNKTPYDVRVSPPLSGDHRGLTAKRDEALNRWQPRDPTGDMFPVRSALNISVQVMFDAIGGSGAITFSSVGVRFTLQ